MKRCGSEYRPPTAREAAFEVLLRVELSGAYASVLLDAWESRLEDPRDGALLHETVLGVLRRQSLLDHLVAGVSSRASEKLDPEVRIALRVGAYGLFFLDRVPGFAAVDTAVDLVKSGPRHGAAGFVNGVLRALGRGGPELLPPTPEGDDVASLALYHAHPEWWVRRVVARRGFAGAADLLEADNRPAATVLRAGRGEAERDGLLGELRAAGIGAEPCEYAPAALRVTSGPPRACAALREGRAWVQDEGAQLVAHLFERPLGRRVADLCAAPGGKSLQLAEWLPDGGWLVAADRHPGRLRKLAGAARRAGATAVLPVRADMATRPPLRGRFDQILLDAPCSGTGTLRRHPEIRWRLREEDLKLLAARQDRLLASAADLLVAGGTLVYAVCSMEPEEGEQVIERFLGVETRLPAGRSSALPSVAGSPIRDRCRIPRDLSGARWTGRFLRRASAAYRREACGLRRGSTMKLRLVFPSARVRGPVGQFLLAAAWLVGGAGLVLLVFGFTFYLAMRVEMRSTEVQVPDLSGLDLDGAHQAVEALDLVLQVDDQRHDPAVASGRVLQQMPPPGASVRRGRKIKLIVSLGGKVLEVPDLIGQAARAVEIELRREGFIPGEEARVHHPDAAGAAW